MATSTPVPVSRYTTAFKPLTQISPTTFRNGYTFLELYENLKSFLLDVLTPELDARLKLIYEETQREVEKLADAIAATEAEWQAAFDLFMDNVIEELEALNDQAVTNLVSNPDSLLRKALDSRYGHVVDIRSHGGKAVAGFNNQPALQAAQNEVTLKGGGTIVIPFSPVPYEFKSGTRLMSNTTVDLMGSTLKLTADHTYNGIFKVTSQGLQGYGSGGKNITLRNGTIQGNFAAGTFIGMSVHHAENILFESIVFDQAIGNGHSIDLMGCKGVTLRDCNFRGRMRVDGRDYVEAVQVDHSTRGGAGSALDELLTSYDGLPTINVLMENCHSESLVVNNEFYYAPRLIGSHSRVADVYHKNITIRDCSIADSGTTATDGRYLGWVHFTHTDGLLIDGMTFYNTRGDGAVAIGLWGVDTTYPLSSVQSPSPALNSEAGSVSSKNVVIKNVVAHGFNSTVLTPFIRLHGSNNTSYITNVTVDGVSVIDGHSGGAPSEGVYIVSGAYAENIDVKTIKGGSVSRAVNLNESKNVSVDGINVSTWCSVALRLDNCTDVVVSGINSKGNNAFNISGGSHVDVSKVNHSVVGVGPVEYAACAGISATKEFIVNNVNLNGAPGSLLEFGLRAYDNAQNGIISTVMSKDIPLGVTYPNTVNVSAFATLVV